MESDCPPAYCCLGFVDMTKDELVVKLMSDLLNEKQKSQEKDKLLTTKDDTIYNLQIMLSCYQVKEANANSFQLVEQSNPTH